MRLGERTRRVGLLLLAVVSIATSVALTILSTMEKNDKDALDSRGVEVSAEVLDVSVDEGGEDGPTSVVTVRFKPRGDDPARITTDVSYSDDFNDDFPNASSEGIRIEYDPRDPELAADPGSGLSTRMDHGLSFGRHRARVRDRAGRAHTPKAPGRQSPDWSDSSRGARLAQLAATSLWRSMAAA